MPGHFDPWTILLSFAIATLAGFVAFASVHHTQGSRYPRLWSAIGGATLGIGIWSMHFVGMLAWHPDFPLFYSLRITALSVLAAIGASWLALHLAVTRTRGTSQSRTLAGAFLVGAGICGMHYTGMAAMRFSDSPLWSSPIVLFSFGIALVASWGAMELLARSLSRPFSLLRQIGASLVIGAAICGMHYTGMVAMILPDGSTCMRTPGSVTGPTLAYLGVGVATLLTIALLTVLSRRKSRADVSQSDLRFQKSTAAGAHTLQS